MIPFFRGGGDVDEKSVSFISPEQRLRKYLEEHPRKSEYTGKAIQSHRLVDKNGEEFEMWMDFGPGMHLEEIGMSGEDAAGSKDEQNRRGKEWKSYAWDSGGKRTDYILWKPGRIYCREPGGGGPDL